MNKVSWSRRTLSHVKPELVQFQLGHQNFSTQKVERKKQLLFQTEEIGHVG